MYSLNLIPNISSSSFQVSATLCSITTTKKRNTVSCTYITFVKAIYLLNFEEISTIRLRYLYDFTTKYFIIFKFICLLLKFSTDACDSLLNDLKLLFRGKESQRTGKHLFM